MGESAPPEVARDVPGTLTIRNKAAGRIVELAALEVPGVVRSGSRIGALTGRALPRAIVDMTSHDPNIRVDIAVRWPMPIAAVCRQVRGKVIADLERLTGRHPSRVDVAVAEILADRDTDVIAEVRELKPAAAHENDRR